MLYAGILWFEVFLSYKFKWTVQMQACGCDVSDVTITILKFKNYPSILLKSTNSSDKSNYTNK